MPIAQRDSLLISIAKEAVLMHGPDYYRDKFPPIIERYLLSPPPNIGEIKIHPTEEKMIGRTFYSVTFLYDKTEERLSKDYATIVSICANTGNPVRIWFGNGMGRSISEDSDWREGTDEPILYQEAIFPDYGSMSIYDANLRNQHDVNIENQTPINKDELLRRGWQVNSGTGLFERTRPDAPPASAQRAIRQAKEDMRRREVERERNRGGEENRD